MQIKTKDLTHIFDKGGVTEHVAIRDVNTEINQNEYIAVIGSTGSGKTTFIEHLNALLKPSKGQVIIGERVVTNSRRKLRKIKETRKRVGIVFQFAEYQLFEETIEKDIIFGPVTMGMSKVDAKKKAEEVIKLVGLDKSYLTRSPFSLSGGQKRRVAIAGILAMEPEVMIFDEPTAGLDPQGEKDMYRIFNKLHKLGKTIIIVTHNLDHALEYTERTIVFKESKLIRDGKTLDIMYDKKFLEKSDLEMPQLSSLVHELESKGKKIGRVKSIKEFAKKLK